MIGSLATPVSLRNDIRPNVEWWEADGKRFDSTADLVASLQPSPTGTDAIYHWRQETQLTNADLRNAALAGAGAGAVGGLLVGGGAGIALELMGVFFTVMTAGFFGMPGGTPIGMLAVGGAAIGAIMGGLSGPSSLKAEFEMGKTVVGKIMPNGATPTFYVNGEVTEAVDLKQYATAQPGPVPDNGPRPWWEKTTVVYSPYDEP